MTLRRLITFLGTESASGVVLMIAALSGMAVAGAS